MDCTESIGGAAAETRIRLPVLVSDGAEKTTVGLESPVLSVLNHGSELQWTLLEPAGNSALDLAGPQVASHIGYVRAVVGTLPAGSREVHWRITLTERK